MEHVFGRHAAVVRMVSGVYGAAYGDDPRVARVHEGIAAFVTRKGRRRGC